MPQQGHLDQLFSSLHRLQKLNITQTVAEQNHSLCQEVIKSLRTYRKRDHVVPAMVKFRIFKITWELVTVQDSGLSSKIF